MATPEATTNTGVQRVTGDQIQMLAAYLQNLANSDQRAYAGLTGYLNGQATLPREMMWQAQQQADRQFALDVASSGLQTAQFNYNQRMGEAQVRLQEQSLLASQRGPKNAIAYNYLLNDMAAPAGQERTPSGASGINQPYGGGGSIGMPQQGNPADVARGQQGVTDWNAAHPSNPNGTVEGGFPNAGNTSLASDQQRGQQAADEWNRTHQSPAGGTVEGGAPSNDPFASVHEAFGLPAMAEGGMAPEGYAIGQYVEQMRAAGRLDEALATLAAKGYSIAPEAPEAPAAPAAPAQAAAPQQAVPVQYAAPQVAAAPQRVAGEYEQDPWEAAITAAYAGLPVDAAGPVAPEPQDPTPLSMGGPRSKYVDQRAYDEWMTGAGGMAGKAAAIRYAGRSPGAESVASKLGEMGPDTVRSIMPEGGRRIADLARRLGPIGNDTIRSIRNLRINIPAYGEGGMTPRANVPANDAWQRDGGRGLTLSGIPGMAQGGIQMGSPVIVGDPKASAPQSPNIEMAAPIVEGGEPGMAVMPVDKMAAGAQGGSPAFDEGYQAMQQGAPDPARMKADKEYLAGVMACQAEKAQAPQGEMPMAADGGVFSNTWYNPQQIADSPSIQKLAGNMPTTGFGANKLDYTLPGTNSALPAGNRANLTTLSRMLPSELGFLEGVVETPREMGGLALDWGDYITSSQRAAPTGARFGASVYG